MICRGSVLPGEHAPDIADRPATEVELVDREVVEHATASVGVGVPVGPVGKRRDAPCPNRSRRTDLSVGDGSVYLAISGEESQHVPDHQSDARLRNGFRDGGGVFQCECERLLAERVEPPRGRRFDKPAVCRGRCTDVDGVDIRVHHRRRIHEGRGVEVVLRDERCSVRTRCDRRYGRVRHFPVPVEVGLRHEAAADEPDSQHTPGSVPET